MTPFDQLGSPAGPSARADSVRRISLALQGGGAFGAFTWGVLDRLLEDEDLTIEAVSGASAGAVNGVLLAEGLRLGGRAGARELLGQFWNRLADDARTSFLTGAAGGSLALDFSSRVVSPYVFNPFNLNPLRTMLASFVSFDALRAAPPFRLLVSATRVADGRLRLFTERDISLDAVLASSCLPLLHHAVEIDGESYWDGGYIANPPLMQLVEASETPAILLVQIIPDRGENHPTSSSGILKRLNQITFNAPLQRDVETLASMKRLCADEPTATDLNRKLSQLTVDHLSAEEWVPRLTEHSSLDLQRSFLEELHRQGRAAASGWLRGEPSPAKLTAETAA